MSNAHSFIDSFTSWANEEQGILAAGLVGSQARGTARPDSDVDLIIVTEQPEVLLHNPHWIKQFGEVESLDTEDWGLVQSMRVAYKNLLEVEYGITTPEWANLAPIDAGTKRVVGDGMKILCDTRNILQSLLSAIKTNEKNY